jgi:hypothetical protein
MVRVLNVRVVIVASRPQSVSAVAVLEQLIGNMVLSDHPCQNYSDMRRYNVPMFRLIFHQLTKSALAAGPGHMQPTALQVLLDKARTEVNVELYQW